MLEAPGAPGEEATLRLRVPGARGPESVFVRYLHDGEARFERAAVDEQSETETWWRASFPVWNTPSRYRWLLSGGRFGYAWVNGRGVARHDLPDADDFLIAHDGAGPEWHAEAIVYEIFPDRFASSGLAVATPEWALPRAWDEGPSGNG
ncbi:MAG TPA: hypothetical protein VG295_07930, partial [Solirubrobacteraceae bacterium]|nr:hypothetical protein [Solirubrobacteraceae bacterium]